MTIFQRIVRAARDGTGLQLSAYDALTLSKNEDIATQGKFDDACAARKSGLLVWGGLTSRRISARPNGSRQARTIVCAKTKKRAMELCGVGRSEFDRFFCVTGNPHELAIAREEGCWVNQGEDYEYKFDLWRP